MLVTDAVWSSTFRTPTGHLATRATLRKEPFLFLRTVWRVDELVLQKVKKSIGSNRLLFCSKIYLRLPNESRHELRLAGISNDIQEADIMKLMKLVTYFSNTPE